ncbi:PadR family transcriptional regulator [Corynebacterium glyciniphilum]|uniref:PadR-like family transcriptional regulator n=1 Tax=Corynebacterium glyciniphilum AJ 3170 TaxID=1404245 RepID=X5ECF7_9CORY|nr:PadR family transcriptional regulator [Corynebacterium glyciniphilum]AHW65085.1 PadR-like family transcriptional regulator [Corynebacterium glyciniphilum AJ 3170]
MSIKFALLSLLAEQPRSVGKLKSDFETRTRDTWPVNVGQVYQTIQRLARDGLIEVTGSDTGASGRHTEIYAVTDAGRSELTTWWHSPVLPPPNDRDDLVIKTAMAASTTGGLPDGMDFASVLHNQRLAVLDELRALTRKKSEVPPSTAADRLQLERRIFDLESQVRWLDQIEALPPATETEEN